MQVVHTTFTYLLLTLIYFHFACKILGKIPDSVLDSVLVLREKKGCNERKTISLANVSDLVKIKPKHANSKIKLLSREIKN